MKKIGLLCLAVVLALGAMGAALALWSETLLMTGTVDTGTVDITYTVIGNDPLGTDDPTWPPADPPKDVAVCTVSDDGAGIVSVLLEKAYPGYGPTLSIDVTNVGSIPVHLYVYLHFKQDTWVSTDYGVNWTPYVACQVIRMETPMDYHFDFDAVPIAGAGQPRTADDTDLSVHLWDIDCTQVHGGDTASGSLGMLVKQDAKENATYAFNLIIVAQQWNEAAVTPTP